MILNNYKTNIVKNIKSMIANNSYYVFFGKVTPWTNEISPDSVIDVIETHTKTKQEMIAGQEIALTDIAFVKKIPSWSYGEIYNMYDEKISTFDYYVINSNYDVYKCIDNNYKSASTDEPLSRSLVTFETADGYKWKYMFSISTTDLSKFGNGDYYPIIENIDVKNNAIPGTIETIIVDNPGANYQTTNGYVQEIVNPIKIRIENDKSNINEYYKDYAIYFETGPSAGEVRRIVSYISDTTGNYIIMDTSVNLDLTTKYIILPQVVITGNGNGAIAIPEVDPISGSINSIKMLSVGMDYAYAEAKIVSNQTHGSGAILKPILSPMDGHGSNPIEEMGCNEIMISVDVDNVNLPVDITYRQIGVLSDLKDETGNPVVDAFFNAYATASVTMDTPGTFVRGEMIEGLDSKATGIVISATNTEVKIIEISGKFQTGETFYGKNSALTGSCNTITFPAINKYDCKILSIENIQAVTRDPSRKENFKQIIKV